MSIAEIAPFGKNTETLVDTAVRKAFQIDPALVAFRGNWLEKHLPMIVDTACIKLGLDRTRHGIEAHLYKLLIYEVGGHFKTHQDTEKEKGMFGTLLIQYQPSMKGVIS